MMIDRQGDEQARVLPAIAVLGEVLWDVFGESRRLGGAPLNFAAHLRRLGHPVSLISALGTDSLGNDAAAKLAKLDLDTRLVQRTSRFVTGIAEVSLGTDGVPEFKIPRPAAYDAIDLNRQDIESLREQAPAWFYFGTLFTATAAGDRLLDRLLAELDVAGRFLDLNLRAGSDAPELIVKRLSQANVVKLNEAELGRVASLAGLPTGIELFCRAACDHFALSAIAVTLGERGCAVLSGGEYVHAPGLPVDVADTVGAGDAFAAAFVHGLSRNWPAEQIAAFANRIAADVASHHGGLPLTARG